VDLTFCGIGAWPDDFFAGVISLLQDDEFLGLEESWQITYFINGNWEELSSTQRLELRAVLVTAFAKYKDLTGAFVTAEILGERYGDEAALNDLIQLGRTTPPEARPYVPHGLEWLVTVSNRQDLRDVVVRELQVLARDETEDVRKEAAISLRKIGVALRG